MKKNNKLTWILLVLWGVMFWYLQSHNKPQNISLPKPEVMLEQALKLEKEAGNNQDALQKAFEAYGKLAKAYAKTEYAAKVRLHMGILQETRLTVKPNVVWKFLGLAKETDRKQEEQAMGAYQAMVKDKNLSKTWDSVKEADARLKNLQAQSNRIKSKRNSLRSI